MKPYGIRYPWWGMMFVMFSVGVVAWNAWLRQLPWCLVAIGATGLGVWTIPLATVNKRRDEENDRLARVLSLMEGRSREHNR